MHKVAAPILGIFLASLIALPAQAGSTSVDASGASAEAAAVVEDAVTAFKSALASRVDCMGSGSVVFESIPGRMGEYRTTEAVVVVNPDRDIETMAATVYHEMAHHLMMMCRVHRDSDFTAAFFAAQDISLGRGWFDDSAGWAATPAEQFADAVVLIVLGSTDGRIQISPEAIEAVRSWIAGEATPRTSEKNLATGTIEEPPAIEAEVAPELDATPKPRPVVASSPQETMEAGIESDPGDDITSGVAESAPTSGWRADSSDTRPEVDHSCSVRYGRFYLV